ncbi:MAG: energy transducer TonB [Bacteroidota bacterium]
MKYNWRQCRLFILLLFSVLFYNNLLAQKDKIFLEAEVSPEYVGGESALNKFIESNVVYPDYCYKNNIGGRAVVRFRVAGSGYVDTAYMIRSPHDLISKECIRLMKSMPRWLPGWQAGRPVAVYFTLPIVFTPGGNSEMENKYNGNKNITPRAIDIKQAADEKKRTTIKEFITQTREEFYRYEDLASTKNNLFADYNKLKILCSDSFLSTQQNYFATKKTAIDSIKNILSDSSNCINDSAINQSFNQLDLYIARELKCIDRFQQFSKLWRSNFQFHPIYNNWYMNDAYTQKYDSHYLTDTINITIFFDLPSFNFTSGKLNKVGYNHFQNLSIGIGYSYKKFTFKATAGFIQGSNPNYPIKYNDSLFKANITVAVILGVQSDYKYFNHKKWSYFINGGIGYIKLNQYAKDSEKNYSKVDAYNSIPVFKLGHSISYRLNPIFFFTFNTNISYLNHQSNAGIDLSGMLYQVGLGIGFLGNKNW